MPRTCTRFGLVLLLSAVLGGWASAQVVDLPGTLSFSDGVRDFAAQPVVDLSLAATGNWDDPSVPGNGIYDPVEWAVVFKYTSVTIPEGTTVTFVNHPRNPPVVWLVEGDVTIDGVLNVDGGLGSAGMYAPTPGGPGGFRGGVRRVGASAPPSAGFGPGAGPSGGSTFGNGGSYGTLGLLSGTAYQPSTYGNAQVLPLIGGSGGSGSNGADKGNGGGGGGAILIVAQGTIGVDGMIQARGGNTTHYAGGGSGGAIRLASTSLQGAGVLDASGGVASGGKHGGLGRIRLETYNALHTFSSVPSAVPVAPDDPVFVWPPDTAPSITITAIHGIATPSDPASDVVLPDVSVVGVTNFQVTLQTTFADPAATVTLKVTRAMGDDFLVTADLDPPGQSGPILNWLTPPIIPGDGIGVLQAKVVEP